MPAYEDASTKSSNLSFIKQSMKEPLLERDHEFDLARRWREQGDEAALHELVRSYTRLVVSTATRFKNYGLSLGDLIQEGNVGLMQAAARFEPDRDVRFSTYASWWIRSAIQDFVLRNWSIVRTGTTAAQKSLFFNLRRLRAQIQSASAEVDLNDEGRAKIADELNVKVSDVVDMESRLSAGDQSLNAVVNVDGELEWQDLLSDDSDTPEQTIMDLRDGATRSQWLSDALGALNDREQLIIKRRRLTEEGTTLEELGRELGVSKERVRQLEQRALTKMRTALEKNASMSDIIG